MSYTYTTYVAALANTLVVPTNDANFLTELPSIIADAELRIYRDLDLLNTVIADSSAALTPGTRGFTFPSTNGTFVVVDKINVITPAGTVSPDLGTRNPLTPIAKESLDFMWPSSNGSTVPVYFAMTTQDQVILGPWPDLAYQVEVTGTFRPAALSSTNVTTILSVYFPDLFLAASMVFGAGYLKNYGASADDPKMSVTWESHYQMLKASAETEEQRKKFNMAGWSSKQPAPAATPPRT